MVDILMGIGYYVIIMSIMGATQTILDPTYYRFANMIEDPKKAISFILPVLILEFVGFIQGYAEV